MSDICPVCGEEYDQSGYCICDPDEDQEEETRPCQCKYCMCLNSVSEWEDVCPECKIGAHQG